MEEEKLKTLKEIEIWNIEPFEIEEKLKTEAVKWVKDWIKNGDQSAYLEFKHFFNITEEDLE